MFPSSTVRLVTVMIVHVCANMYTTCLGTQQDEPPSVGSRTPNYWSICFQGGTFERIQERASGDFSLTKQTKYIAQLPALSERIVDERLPRLAYVLLVSIFHAC